MNMTRVAVPSLAPASGDPLSAAHDEPERIGFMARNMRLDVKPCFPGKQCFSVVTSNFGPVRIARVHGTRASYIRTSRHLADGHDLISVVISVSGQFLLDGVQGQDRFGPKGAAILESRRESALHKLDDIRGSWTICMERAPLEPLIAGVSDPVQRCVQADNPGLRLLVSYLGALFAMGDAPDPALATLHIRDLVLSTLGVRGEVQALVRERGVHAARQSVVLETIRRRAGEQSLDPASVAVQSGISVRYLHQLLEPTGRTFSQHLLEQRLERARVELRKPDHRRKIADIAVDCGFSDISHFNRSFRRAFGDTPNGVRVRAARASRAQESATGQRVHV
jgi:AraC-like DNA-binding protein